MKLPSGGYLVLFQRAWQLGEEDMPRELRALVRTPKSCGDDLVIMLRFMPSGEQVIRARGHFGCDGLPVSVPRLCRERSSINPRLWEYLHRVPEKLSEAFWRGTREQAAGRMCRWAVAHETRLRGYVKPDRPPTEFVREELRDRTK
jgi:hypothetical protein